MGLFLPTAEAFAAGFISAMGLIVLVDFLRTVKVGVSRVCRTKRYT